MNEQPIKTLAALAMQLAPIFRKYHVLRVVVFGSVARGEATRRSDLALIVIQQTEQRFLDRYDGILAEITQAVGPQSVDLLIYTPEEAAHCVNRRWMANVLRDGKLIYESNGQCLSS